MRFRDSRTISAISVLRYGFPYAAALLSYVVVERVLKRYLQDHWRDPRLANRRLPDLRRLKEYRGKSLGELRGLTAKGRMTKVITRLTLGDVEALLKRNAHHQSASDRNEVMHSNWYLKEESRLGRSRQQAKNEERFARARKHLARAMARFSDYKLVECDGMLTVRATKRMDRYGAGTLH